MSRAKFVLFALLAAGCATAPHDPERERLLDHHREIFRFLGLSEHAVEELCGKVAWVYDAMARQRQADPAAFAAMAEITRRGHPRNYEEALAAHRRRFEALGLSPETQRELEEAFTAVYRDLHSSTPSARALRIREMMAQLPPCCDDAIWERAGVAPP